MRVHIDDGCLVFLTRREADSSIHTFSEVQPPNFIVYNTFGCGFGPPFFYLRPSDNDICIKHRKITKRAGLAQLAHPTPIRPIRCAFQASPGHSCLRCPRVFAVQPKSTNVPQAHEASSECVRCAFDALWGQRVVRKSQTCGPFPSPTVLTRRQLVRSWRRRWASSCSESTGSGRLCRPRC